MLMKVQGTEWENRNSSMIISNGIVFIWLDTEHVFLASDHQKNNAILPISRRLKNAQWVTINCHKAIKDQYQFWRGFDRLSQITSGYSLHRKSKGNRCRISISFLNASISNSSIHYSQLARDKLTYLNYIIWVAKCLCRQWTNKPWMTSLRKEV